METLARSPRPIGGGAGHFAFAGVTPDMPRHSTHADQLAAPRDSISIAVADGPAFVVSGVRFVLIRFPATGDARTGRSELRW